MHVTVIGKYGIVAAVSGMFVGPLPSSSDTETVLVSTDERVLERIALHVGPANDTPIELAARREPTPIRRRQAGKAA